MYTEALGTIRLEAGCALTEKKNSSHEIAHFDYLCVRSVFLKSSKFYYTVPCVCVLKCDQKMS